MEKKKPKKRVKVYRERVKTGQVETSEVAKLKSLYEDIDPASVKDFKDLPLSKNTLKGLHDSGFKVPTEIQRESIGLALKRLDILGAAQTGSGKTLAFIIPIIEILYTERWTAVDGLGALIITPTRELAYQIFETLRNVGRHHGFSAGLIIGGKDLKFEQKRLQFCNIMVCTPGRLLQHMNENPLMDPTHLQVLVIDEADRCLDLGFEATMNGIIENLPPKRQTLLFSATQTKSVKDLARLSLKDPMYVSVHENAKHSTPEGLRQSYIVCEIHEKLDVLWSFVTTHRKHKVLVFLTCCKQVRFIYSLMCRMRPGNSLMQLHGGMHQLKRMNVYEEFCRKEHAVLFATDVAARGLDFPAVDWVIQYDCPDDANTYIHRAGRTARYTKSGESLLLLSPNEEPGMIKRIEEKKIPINRIEVNPKKMLSIQRKLEAILARDQEMKQMAQRAFVTYVKSVFLMKDKEVFDVTKIDLEALSRSMGLAIAPRVRFLKKKDVQLRKPGQASEPDSDQDEDQPEIPNHQSVKPGKTAKKTFDFGIVDSDDENENLMVIKRKDHDLEDVPEIPRGLEKKKKTKAVTKEAAAKKILKKNIKTNTKVTYDDEGNMQMDATRRKMTEAAQEYEKSALSAETPGGIDIERAKAVLREEDKADKQLFREKIKAKHREKRLKDKEERRKIAKSKEEKDDESESDYESDDNIVSDIIDSLPDPDKIYGPKSGSDSDSEYRESPKKKKPGKKRKASGSHSDDELTVPSRRSAKKQKVKKIKSDDLSLNNYEELALRMLDI